MESPARWENAVGMKDSGPGFCHTCFLVIKPYSPKEMSIRAKSPASRSNEGREIGKDQHGIRKILRRYSHDQDAWGDWEKVRGRRRAGPQRRLMSGTQSVSRFLMQYVAGRLDLRASIWSINNWHNSCKLHARVVRLAIKLEQMERKCWAWREYNHQGEGWRRRRYIASRMFNILCRESSGLLFDGGKNTLVRVTRRTRPRIVSLSPKIRVISQIPHLPLTVPAKQKKPVPFAGRWPVKSGLVVPCLGVEFLFQSLGFHSIYVWDFWALQLMRERGCDC